MNPQMPMQPMKYEPLRGGTRVVFINNDDVEFIKTDCVAAAKALDMIDAVSDLAAPVDSTIHRGHFDDEMLKTILLSGNVNAVREMMFAPQMNEYIRAVYKIHTTDSKFLDDDQKTGLKNLEMKFDNTKPYLQDELNYINNLVDEYIDKVQPIIFETDQAMIVQYKDQEKKARIPLHKTIVLI